MSEGHDHANYPHLQTSQMGAGCCRKTDPHTKCQLEQPLYRCCTPALSAPRASPRAWLHFEISNYLIAQKGKYHQVRAVPTYWTISKLMCHWICKPRNKDPIKIKTIPVQNCPRARNFYLKDGCNVRLETVKNATGIASSLCIFALDQSHNLWKSKKAHTVA